MSTMESELPNGHAIVSEKPDLRTHETFSLLSDYKHYWLVNEALLGDDILYKELLHQINRRSSVSDGLKNKVTAFIHLSDPLKFVTYMFRYNFVTTLFSIFELGLISFVVEIVKQDKNATISNLSKKKNVFEKCKESLKEHSISRVELCDRKYYPHLHDLKNLRDIITHCYGRLKNVNNDYWSILLRMEKSKIGIKTNGYSATDPLLVVEKLCIENHFQYVWNYFLYLYDQVGWKVCKHNLKPNLIKFL